MRTYEGKGTISFPKVKDVQGSFQLTFQEDCKVNLIFHPDGKLPIEVLNFDVTLGTFSGKSVNSEYHIEIDKIRLTKMNMVSFDDTTLGFTIFNPVKITYQPINKKDKIELSRGISNLLFWGTETTRYGDRFSRGTLRFKLEKNKEAYLVQLKDFRKIEKHLKENGGVRVTSELKIEGSYNEIEKLREMSKDIQVLCSLASGNYVTAMYEDIFNKNSHALCKTTLLPLKTYPFSSRMPLIDTRPQYARDLKDYLESTYTLFKKRKNPLRLPYVIELFITSKIYTPIELQYLLSTTSLECLEYHFRNWQSLRKIDPLNDKTERLLNHFNVPHNNTEVQINTIRNSIVHEGRFPTNVDGFKSLMELRNLLDRTLLVILGYKNKPYYNIVLGDKDRIQLQRDSRQRI
jgi:hypothetical protein